mgnify:CR=1 FL=1
MTARTCLFVGSKRMGVRVLETMLAEGREQVVGIVTFDDSADARSALPSFVELSRQTSLPLFVLKKGSEIREVVLQTKPDFCVVSGWYWLLDQSLLDLCPGGFVGLHGSLLPRYRGFAPLVWALIEGESELGISLFYFSEGMDEGDIIEQFPFTAGPDATISEVLNEAEDASVELIRRNFRPLVEGRAARSSQPASGANYCAQRVPSDGRIDWRWDAGRIHNFVRAQSAPYPGAFFADPRGQNVTVDAAEVFGAQYLGAPGQVLRSGPGYALVICGGRSAIRIRFAEAVSLRFGERLASPIQ